MNLIQESDRPNQPATLRTMLCIIGGLAALILGTMGAVLLTVGNTSIAMPLWSGILFWGLSATALIMTWLSPRYTFLPVLVVFVLSALGAGVGARTGEFWPARLIWHASTTANLLTIMWLACMVYALWRTWHTGSWHDIGSSMSRRLPRGIGVPSAILLVAIIVWTGTTACQLSIRNAAYLLPGEPAQRTLQVVDSNESGLFRLGNGAATVLTFRDDTGREQHIDIDDLFRRTAGVFRRTDPRRSSALLECWNQSYRSGDVVTVQGRRNWAGFSIDRVVAVQRGHSSLCKPGN